MFSVSGQDSENQQDIFKWKNSLQAELFGHGLFYSFSYERSLINKPGFKTTCQAGASYYSPQSGIINLWMPVLINELMSFDRHHIELGIGHVITWSEGGYWEPFGTFRIGYRFQKPTARLLVRAAFTPFIEYWRNQGGVRIIAHPAVEFHPSGGLAFGYAF